MLFEAEKVAHLRRRRQWRQQSDRRGVDRAAAGAPRICDDVPRPIERGGTAFDQRLHARECGTGVSPRRRKVDNAPVAIDQRADALITRGDEGDKAHCMILPLVVRAFLIACFILFH